MVAVYNINIPCNMEFDELLTNYLGEIGKYQVVMFLVVSLTAIAAAFNNLSIVFLAGTPNHWCHTPELDSFNISDEARWNLTLPLEEKDGEWTFSKCQFYNRSFVGWSDEEALEAAQSSLQLRNFSQEGCMYGWQYDHSTYGSTIVTEWDLVCNRQFLTSTAASVHMVGLLVGGLVFGQISDWLGRKSVLCGCSVIMVALSISVAFSPNYIIFIILRFCVATVASPLFYTAFVFAQEIVGPSWRVCVATVLNVMFVIGIMIIPGVAYVTRDWRMLQLALACPLAVLLMYFVVLPESPRWLYAKNKVKQADAIVRRIAKINRKKLPDKIQIVIKKDRRNSSIIDLFRTKRLLLITIIMGFIWFVSSLVYLGLTLATPNLGGNVYFNFLLSGAVEIISVVLFAALLPRLGRRLTLAGAMVIAGVALLGTLAIPSDLLWLQITLTMLGKLAISLSCITVDLFNSEIYPTVVRNIALTTCSLFGRLGGVCAPFIGQLTVVSSFLPTVIFGSFAVLSGLLSLFLPETKNKKLADTIAEGENLGLPESTEIKQPMLQVVNEPVCESGNNGNTQL